MGRIRKTSVTDPETGKSFPDGVVYRGPKQYSARKLIEGKRVTKTFIYAKRASHWLSDIEGDRRRGMYVDRQEAERQKLGDIILRDEQITP